MPDVEEEVDIEPRGLLPDDSWIAIVCGVSKEQWNAQGGEDEGLPEGFYVAPKDIYMPDLTAVADVLLGKLVSDLMPSRQSTQSKLTTGNLGIRNRLRMRRLMHAFRIRSVIPQFVPLPLFNPMCYL